MVAPLSSPAHAYAPFADRSRPEVWARSLEGLVRWLALLMVFLLNPWNTIRVLWAGRLASLWLQHRPDLPAGSAQAAWVRGSFGNAIRWMCLRHGIGPGHKDWPKLSRAIVAFGGTLRGCRAGRRPLGLQWWESPYIVPGLVTDVGKSPRRPRCSWSRMRLRMCCRRRRTPYKPQPRMHGCQSHGWPYPSGTFLLVLALFRRPGRLIARDCQFLSCLMHGAGAWPARRPASCRLKIPCRAGRG
jgi:hypothetical protein